MKKITPIPFLSCLIILFCGLALSPAQAGEQGLLDDMKFEGSLVEDGSAAAPNEETLTFEKGEFISMACVSFGFGKAPYTAAKEGDKITWSAEVPSSLSEGEKAVWRGTVIGDKLTGVMIWEKASHETIEFSVVGTKK